MEILAIIPARGGSKGIPRKNILSLLGKPLIAYNIEQARKAHLVNRLVVSTDDAEIAAISRQFGAEVVWRPAEISGDTASSESALLHTLAFLNQAEGYQPDLLVFLQCTSPLTLSADIDGTIQALLDANADTALAAIPFHYFVWKTNSGGDVVGINHDKSVRPLRQEREAQFLETGAVYAMRVQGFLKARHRFFGKTALYEMPVERRLEIDDPVDFQIAETLLRAQADQEKASYLPAKVSALVMDFDGVFTDNKVVVFQDGSEAVVCDRGDGWGIGRLKKTGLPLLILSTEPNPVVRARAEKLGLPCLQNVEDKWSALQAWLQAQGIDPAQVVYLGNDANDLPCMTRVGCAVAPADAHPSARDVAHILLEHRGGDGAIRELCDLLLARTPANQLSGNPG